MGRIHSGSNSKEHSGRCLLEIKRESILRDEEARVGQVGMDAYDLFLRQEKLREAWEELEIAYVRALKYSSYSTANSTSDRPVHKGKKRKSKQHLAINAHRSISKKCE